MSELPWFKFYHEAIRDEKLVLAAARTHQTFIEILGVWTIMLSLAAKSPTRGTLMLSDQSQYYEGDLASLCHLEIENMDLIIRAFCQLEMLEYDDDTHVMKIKNWDKRQSLPEKDETSPGAIRTRRWREKMASQTVTERHGDASPLTSISISLIKDSLTENEEKMYDFHDAELLYIKITEQPAMPPSARDKLEMILSCIQTYGYEETSKRMDRRWNEWINKKRSNGTPYSKLNTAWIDYIMVDDLLGTPPEPTREEQILHDIEVMTRRNQ
jgi:hypothetical protein